MKSFAELMKETDSKLPAIPAIKKPAKAAAKGREAIPGLDAKVVETDKVETIAEAASFKTSADATDYVDELSDRINTAKTLADDPKLMAWCKQTDSNFGGKTASYLKDLIKQLDTARAGFDKLLNELEDAE